jgi:hypothetical protein
MCSTTFDWPHHDHWVSLWRRGREMTDIASRTDFESELALIGHSSLDPWLLEARLEILLRFE